MLELSSWGLLELSIEQVPAQVSTSDRWRAGERGSSILTETCNAAAVEPWGFGGVQCLKSGAPSQSGFFEPLVGKGRSFCVHSPIRTDIGFAIATSVAHAVSTCRYDLNMCVALWSRRLKPSTGAARRDAT